MNPFDAINEANRSLTAKNACLEKLDKWNGKGYVRVAEYVTESELAKAYGTH